MDRRLVCAFVAFLACVPGTAWAQDGAMGRSGDKQEVEEFVLGSAVWKVYRELGRELMQTLRLPTVGGEEDALDGFATWRMIEGPLGNGSDGLQLAASRYLALSAESPGGRKREAAFRAAHSLDLQRRFAVVCLLVGSDPEGRRQFAIDAGLPEDRIEECPGQYESMRDGWERLLAPHVPSNGSGVRTSGGSKIEVAFGPTYSRRHQRLRRLVKNSGLVKVAADDVLTLVALPRRITVRFQECFGPQRTPFEANADRVLFCYRDVSMLRSLIRRDKAERKDPAERQTGEGPRFFPELSQEEERSAIFVLGNTLFAVYHELARGLIHELDLPIVVDEANAADSFAAVQMIPEGADDLADALVVAALDGWRLAGRALGDLPVGSGDHVNLQRYYSVLCLFVGSDLGELRDFGKMADLKGMRAVQCEEEYRLSVEGWSELLRAHAPPAGVNGSGSIGVAYEEGPQGGEATALRDLVKESGMVEAAAGRVARLVGLPRDLPVLFTDCAEDGGDETFFDAEGGRVVVCYGFLARMDALGKQAAVEGAAP